MASRRPGVASLARGLMSSSPDQQLADLEAGEGEPLAHGVPVTYVSPGRGDPANSWTPNSMLVSSLTLQTNPINILYDQGRDYKEYCQQIRPFSDLYHPLPCYGSAIDHDCRPQSSE